MSIIKNLHILLYCYFSKTIKGSRTSFQSLTLSQKHVKYVCHTTHQSLTKFHFDRTQDSEETSRSVTFTHILKSVDFTKTQKARYLQNETLFLSQIKKLHQLGIKGQFMAKNCVVPEVTYNIWIINKHCLLIYFLVDNIFLRHDWFVCLRFSLILICAAMFKWENCDSNSVLKNLRKLMDLPRAGENMCVLFDP